MKIGKLSGLLVIIVFFFLLNVMASTFTYFVMFPIALLLYVLFYRIENGSTTNIFIPAKIDIKNSFMCVFLGLSLSLSVWGLAAVQLLLSVDYLSSETLLEWGFSNATSSTFAPQSFTTAGWEIALVGYLLVFSKTIIAGPFVEELYFRGLALKLWEVKYGKILAIIFSSIFFMLIHLNNPMLLMGVFIHGAVFCLIFYRFKHVFYCFLAHASYNFAITIWNMLGAKDLFFDKKIEQLNTFFTWSTEFSVLALSIFLFAVIFNSTKTTSNTMNK